MGKLSRRALSMLLAAAMIAPQGGIFASDISEEASQTNEAASSFELYTTSATANVVESGTFGTELTWAVYDSGELFISGNGAMPDYSWSTPAPWYSLREQITSVVVDTGIAGVGKHAFYNLTKLYSVQISDTVAYIGNRAFWWCESLTTVQLGNSVATIGYNAFDTCPNLTSINIPESVTFIGHNAFSGCTSLQNLNIPETVSYVGGVTFYECDTITTANIPGNTTEIGGLSYYGCDNLTSVSIHEDIESVGVWAFRHCKNLASVTIYSPNARFETDVFEGVSSKFTVYAYSGSTAHTYALENDYNFEPLPGTGGISASGECGENLDWILYEDGILEIIGVGEMYDYTSSSPAPWDAHCDKITKVSVGDGVTSIGEAAFASCTALTGFTVDSENESFAADNYGVLYNKEMTTLIQYPIASTSTSYTVLSNVTAISASAFEGSQSLESVTIGNGVLNIGESAFANCPKLEKVTVDARATKYGSGVFSGTAENLMIYGRKGSTTETYANENSHTFVQLRTALASGQCGTNATWTFYDNGELEITGTGAMYDWTGNTYVPWYSYSDQITSVTIGSGITTIGNYAFANCSKLESICIGDDVTSIGSYAFRRCKVLTSVKIPEKVSTIGASAFYYCSALAEVNIPEGVSIIASNTFSGCSALKTVIIPESVATISNNAFSYCTSLAKVIIEGRTVTFGSVVFNRVAANFAIHGYIDSTAETYAKKNSITFVAVDESVTYVAKIGNRRYTTIADALADSGDITLLMNIEDEVIVGKVVSIIKNGFTANIVPAEGYKLIDADDAYNIDTENTEKFEFVGVNTTLGSSLSLNFAIDMTKITGTDNYVKMTIDYADDREDKTVIVPQSEWVPVGNSNVSTANFTGMAAKQMNDVVTAVVYNADDQKISYEKRDSIVSYSMRMLNKGKADTDELRAVYVDMLNYGAAAQEYFKYDTGNLANRHLTPEQQGYATGKVEIADNGVAGDGYVGTILTLDDEIQLSLVFDNDTVGDNYTNLYAKVTYTSHGGTSYDYRIDGTEFTKYSDTQYRVWITTLAIADYKTLVTCKIYDSTGNEIASAKDSIESYAKRNLDNLGTTVESIVKFGASSYNVLKQLHQD